MHQDDEAGSHTPVNAHSIWSGIEMSQGMRQAGVRAWDTWCVWWGLHRMQVGCCQGDRTQQLLSPCMNA